VMMSESVWIVMMMRVCVECVMMRECGFFVMSVVSVWICDDDDDDDDDFNDDDCVCVDIFVF